MVTRIIVPVGCRSDEGLSAPIIKRLQNNPAFHVDILDLSQVAGDVIQSIIHTELNTKYLNPKPDLALIVGDRAEMYGAAISFFNHDINIAHIYAGAISGESTQDQFYRASITLFSDIQFCESVTAVFRVRELKKSAGLKSHEFLTGATHLDDVVVDLSLIPSKDYDLILYNPITLGNNPPAQIIEEIDHIAELVKDSGRLICWIGPNPDIYNVLVKDKIDQLISAGARSQTGLYERSYYSDNVPRPQFLGLLKHCSRFIGNSSAQFYEAPYFLKPEQIINIGTRNADRETVTLYEASDKIVKHLEELYDKN